jgi:hypothetical protein
MPLSNGIVQTDCNNNLLVHETSCLVVVLVADHVMASCDLASWDISPYQVAYTVEEIAAF